jgi:acyl-coenzyme A thioesterase PaaI-like protein
VTVLDAIRRRIAAQLKGPRLVQVLNAYPPYLGAGVRVRELGPYGFESSMALHPWNRNYFGTHFGGSLYAMCDPFFALILNRNLGPRFAAWDKSATVRFRAPGRGTVRARFEIAPEQVEEIRRLATEKGKHEALFTAEVRDEDGQLVAEVEKCVHVRLQDGKSG